MVNDRYLAAGIFVLILVIGIFSWLVAFGPLYEEMAYPGDIQPRTAPTTVGADCINHVFYYNGQVVPMTDGVIERDCGGQ